MPNRTILFSKTTVITDAQMKALVTTPIEIVPAPGEGKIINVVDLVYHLNSDAGAYTLSDASPLTGDTNIIIKWGSFTGAEAGDRQRGDFSIGGAGDIVCFMGGTNKRNGSNGVAAEMGNMNLNISIESEEGDGTINLGGGHENNIHTVTVSYSIIDL